MDFSKIDVRLLFVITLTCSIVTTNLKAYYIKKRVNRESQQYSLNAIISLFCAVTIFIISGFDIKVSWYSVLLGIAFGGITMLSSLISAKAIRVGPYGYTMVITNLSTAITALSGALFWGEKLSVFKIVGIVLMCLCFFLAIDTKAEEGKKANLTWLLLCFASLIFLASLGYMQKVHQTSNYKDELMPFLVVCFLTSVVVSSLGYLLYRKKEEKSEQFDKNDKGFTFFLIVCLICGICLAGNNALNLYLVGVVETAIFFPLGNGIPLLSTLIVSFIVFREKLSKKQLIGLLVGVIAIICLFL